MKKTLMSMAVAASIGLVAAPASALVVGNIDFGSSGLVHLETMTLAQQYINPTTTPGTGEGWGYGLVSTLNGDATYCASGDCYLYYTVHFTGATFTGTSSVTFTGTDVDLYYQTGSALNFLFGGTNSATNLATIQGMTQYAALVAHGVSKAEGSLSGLTLNLTGTGLLDIDVAGSSNAAFAAALDGNSIPDGSGGFADIAFTESSNNFVLNATDIQDGLANGCSNGTAASGAWCWQGTLNTRGSLVIPEPGTLALFGMGLVGFGLTRRRKN